MAINSNDRINRQIPQTIRRDYPRFVEFLRSYYEWLEQPGNPYHHIRNHLSYLDFENSLNEYVDQLKQEYLVNIPQDVFGNKELFIKYAKKFNITIGSEKSFDFVFNMLFNENVELYYPKQDILRASDGKWIGDESTLFITNAENPDKFTSRRIVQYDNDQIVASAVVDRVKRRIVGRYKIAEVVVTNVEGEFDPDLALFPIGKEDEVAEEWLLPVGVDYTINDGGTNYAQGDSLEVPSGLTYTVTDIARNNNRFDTRITTAMSESTIEFYHNGSFVDPNLYEFDGQVIFYDDIASGDDVEVVFPTFEGFVIVGGIENGTGAINNVDIIEPPVGIQNSVSMIADDGGVGADITLSRGSRRESDGYFRTSDGFLSGSDVLQDSDFYQEFSYIIRTAQNIDKYRDVVMDVLHPAGMKMFGQINIKFLINLMIRDVTFDRQVKPPIDTLITEGADLGPTYSFLDRVKNYLVGEDVKVINYADIVTDNFISTPTRRWNIADIKRITKCVDEYMELEDYYEFGYVCEGVYDTPNCIDEYADDGYNDFGYVCESET